MFRLFIDTCGAVLVGLIICVPLGIGLAKMLA